MVEVVADFRRASLRGAVCDVLMKMEVSPRDLPVDGGLRPMQRFGPRQARLMLGGLDYLGTLLFGLDEKRLFGSSLTATMRLRTMA